MLNTHVPLKLEQLSFCTAIFQRSHDMLTRSFLRERVTNDGITRGGGGAGKKGRVVNVQGLWVIIRVSFVEL